MDLKEKIESDYLGETVAPFLLSTSTHKIISSTLYTNEMLRLLPPGILLECILEFLIGSSSRPETISDQNEYLLRSTLIQRISSPIVQVTLSSFFTFFFLKSFC